jgi:TonB-linked SusC/RagA family outer membrane protein
MKHQQVLLRVQLLVVALLLSGWALAQTISLSGKVTDESGEGLPGVTVRLQDAGLGTITDLDGNYRISGRVQKGVYQLTCSLTGFNTFSRTINLNGDLTETIDVQLGNGALNLDEVVVTGASSRASRRSLGNSTYSVSEKDLQNTGTPNALSALQGKVPGARIVQTSGDPAGGINVQLRGVNSLRGGNDPLFVIDGVIVSNATTSVAQSAVDGGSASFGANRLADLNPNDIESISIYSGASMAAQYGSRAANGVVFITTKRGATAKPEITVSTSVNMNQLRKKVYISTFGKQFGTTDLRLHTINPAPAGVTETVTVLGRALANNLVDVTRYDYQDLVFQDGMGTDNSISVKGGKDNTRYYASFGYMNNEGIVKGTDFRRYALRLNLDQNLASWAKMSVGMSYTNSFANEKPNGNSFFSPINSINITNNIYKADELDANGNLKAVEPTRVNPLSVVNDFNFNTAVNRATGSAQLTLFPFKGMVLNYIVGIDAYSALGKQFIPRYPYSGVNTAYYRDGFAGTGTDLSVLFNNDFTATYTKAFGKMTSTSSAGFNYQYSEFNGQRSAGQNLAPVISTVNGAAASVTTSYGLDRFSLSGGFLQQAFGYDNWAFVELAGRIDNSSKFSDDEANQFYPKASVSVVASEFWKNSSLAKMLNTVRVRGAFGEAGGVTALGSYDRFWQFSPVQFLGKNTILPGSQYANPAVRPERTRELEAGIDIAAWNNRIAFGATVYQQNVFDLVVNRTLAPSSGGASIVNNVGELENKGVELSLNITPVRTKNFNWNVFGIYSRNRNKVVKAGSPTVSISTVSGAPIFIVEGEAASVFLGTYAATNADGSIIPLPNSNTLLQIERGTETVYTPGSPIPEGSYVVGGRMFTPKRDANGQPTGSALRKIIGNPNPDYTMSFGSGLNYKGLSFNFLLDGAFGFDVFNADRRTRQGVGIGDYAEKELKRELERGYIWAFYPVEAWRVEDGTYLKLREISLGYNLGKVGGISNLTISLVGRNLYSWDNYDGYDPETNAGGTSDFLRGVDFGNVPIPRTYQAMVTARF